MPIDAQLSEVVAAFGWDAADLSSAVLGSGLINTTWEVKQTSGKGHWVVQAINESVFSAPHLIDQNLKVLQTHLARKGKEGLAVFPLRALDGRTLVTSGGLPCRVFPFVAGSVVHTQLSSPDLAWEAAQAFGRFGAALADVSPSTITPAIPGFHRLDQRYQQFEQALSGADAERRAAAKDLIQVAQDQQVWVDRYLVLVTDPLVPLRLQHHDTKISNVLFDDKGKALVVIDLDTVMPGYFFSDLGDMLRTYLCAASEESTDWDQIVVRPAYREAILAGYAAGMGEALWPAERAAFFDAGAIMMYMQALRFLTDFLNGDVYYKVQHPLHNHNRAKNQLTLLHAYLN